MANVVTIVVDGEVVVEGSIDQWVRRSPEEARKFLNPSDKPSDPGMVCLLQTIAMAAAKQKPLQATLTHAEGGGWNLSARYRGGAPKRPASSMGVLQHLNVKHGQPKTQSMARHEHIGHAGGCPDDCPVAAEQRPLSSGDYCPGSSDPRCKGLCTVDGRSGVIKDPDCFRSVSYTENDGGTA